MTTETVTNVEYARMNREVYERFASQFPKTHVDNVTSPLQAGFQLGIQRVLEALRKDIVTKV